MRTPFIEGKSKVSVMSAKIEEFSTALFKVSIGRSCAQKGNAFILIHSLWETRFVMFAGYQ
jgi:hypothetical protein